MLDNAQQRVATSPGRGPRPPVAAIRVLLVHPGVPGPVGLLPPADDLVVVGRAADGEEAVQLAAELHPDVVLLALPAAADAVGVVRALHAGEPRTRVLVLAASPGPHGLTAALTAGAAGYLLADSGPRDLAAAVRSAAQGHTPIDPRVARALLPAARPAAGPAEVLSGRERQVLSLVAAGLLNAEIASSLGISENTVKVHLTKIYRTIGVPDRAAAVRWAQEHLPLR